MWGTHYKNSPGWLLGATEGNTLKFSYDSKRWDRIKSLALRRDGYRCQLSKRYGRAVQAEVVHHIYPVEDYPEYASAHLFFDHAIRYALLASTK